jgi:hypothetical protein
MNPASNRKGYSILVDPVQNELDLQVYTMPYKNKIRAEAHMLQIAIQPQIENETSESEVSRQILQKRGKQAGNNN